MTEVFIQYLKNLLKWSYSMKAKSLVMFLVCAMVVVISATYGLSADKSVENPVVETSRAVDSSLAADKIDLNKADTQMLISLPGIGPKTAEKIVAYRETNGPFTSVEDLLNIKGIGPDKLEKIRQLVTLS
jgi:comEA protein